ncbi:hypothetical protein [Streptomyces sp. CC208A]|uniref:hypothetical protein n=1 Tax=Streptomyces sp. CC208A TaxID=3044573 RepID=UPI0024A87CED|nr:hypothetical protein [Streptomyces sp. CC208A]
MARVRFPSSALHAKPQVSDLGLRRRLDLSGRAHRTGSALLLAGLGTWGTAALSGLDQLRRGHADLPAETRSLGAARSPSRRSSA